ncbi:MAG: efflux RND transporter periplasmic adaptor subunit [Pirellulales bacterium]|nr:efflux RND transporter periplasmic adaptor subunit [Pirellulales bacterium]
MSDPSPAHFPLKNSALGLIACLLIAGCQPPPPASGPPPAMSVTTVKPLVKSIVEWDEYVGRLEAIEFVEVRSRVAGYLDEIKFGEGDIVQQGQVLFVIDPKPFAALVKASRAMVNESQANLEKAKSGMIEAEAQQVSAKARNDLAQKNFNRAAILIKNNTISREDYDLAESKQVETASEVEAAAAQLAVSRANYESAQAAVKTAEANAAVAELELSYTQVTAPITGRISRQYITRGNWISGGTSPQSTLLTTIVSLNPIHCIFDADEAAYLKYVRLAKSGERESSRVVRNPVYLALADEKSFPHQGHMDFVDNRLDQDTATIRGRAIFKNDDLTLTPGLFARVRLPGSERHSAIMLPDQAIGTDLAEKFVYVVEAGNKIRRQVVTLGPIIDGLQLIREGLKGDETIVLDGIQRVRPGSEVQAKMVTFEPVEDGLPDDYQPVPQDQWISRQSSPVTVENEELKN